MKNKFKLYFGTILCKFTNRMFIRIMKRNSSGKDLIALGYRYNAACYNALMYAGFDYKYKNVFYQGYLISEKCVIKGYRMIGKFEQAQDLENHLNIMPEKLP